MRIPKIPLAGIKYKCYRDSTVESALVTTITSIHKLLHTWQNKVTSYIVLNEFSKSRLLDSSLNLPANKFLIKPNFIPDPRKDSGQEKATFCSLAGFPEKKVDISCWKHLQICLSTIC